MGKESFFFAVNFAFARVKVCFVGFDHFGLHEEFVAEDADEVDGDALVDIS